MANVDDFFIDDNSVGLISEASYENINNIIDEIEALAGVDLFYGLPDDIEAKIEGEDNIADWAL